MQKEKQKCYRKEKIINFEWMNMYTFGEGAQKGEKNSRSRKLLSYKTFLFRKALTAQVGAQPNVLFIPSIHP